MPVAQDVAGFSCYEVQFTKDGGVNTAADLDGAAAFVKDKGLTDLFVISHGWNNDLADARALYANFFAKIGGILGGGHVPDVDGRTFGVLAVLWPSKKFADRDLIPSGAAAAGSAQAQHEVENYLDELHGFFDNPGSDQALDEAKALLSQLEDSSKARRRFADLVRSALPPPGPDPEGAAAQFVSKDGDALMRQMKDPIIVVDPAAGPGGAAGLGDALHNAGGAIVRGLQNAGAAILDAGQSAVDAAERTLNYATYYQMKERAGTVGRSGVYQVLRRIRDGVPAVKLHLIGHSFGGRLVCAAALGPDAQPPIKPETLTLLQAAFSHDGFGQKFDGNHDGFFRRIVSDHQIAGPALITYTANDRAVGLAYALASRVAGQVGAGLGDASDRFGGIGRNGAQHTPEATFLTLGPVGSSYSFAPGNLYNLHADAIADHSDICKDEIAYALLAAVAKA